MSRPGLNDDITMNTTGNSDQVAMTTNATVLPTPASSRLGSMRGLLLEAPDIERGERERGDDHDPGGRRRGAKGVVAERFQIEIDRHHLGRAGRSALRHQPGLGE